MIVNPTEFDEAAQAAFLSNPFNTRRVANCAKCGAKTGQDCIGTRNWRAMHRERHEATKAYVAQQVADIQAAEDRMRNRTFTAHKVREAAEILDSIGVTLSASPEQAWRAYEYSCRKGEQVDNDTFTEDVVKSAQRYRIRNA